MSQIQINMTESHVSLFCENSLTIHSYVQQQQQQLKSIFFSIMTNIQYVC